MHHRYRKNNVAKILIAEDDHAIRELLAESLAELGHEVEGSATGDEAIDLGYSYGPDVIIADWDLGCDYDGFEVAAACFHANKSVKTIVISGHAERLQQFESRDFVHSTLAKPFSYERLLESVEDAIRSGPGSLSSKLA